MHSKIKRILSCVLVAVIVFSSLIVSGNLVFADSNDRIATYINLAKDGTITNGSTEGMTEDQLRFLGIYLSNFYIPFGTEIGTSGGETAETTKKDMVETLKQKFAFSDELATSLVETVFGYTRSSLKDLSVYVSKEYQDGDYKKVEIAPNYYNFLRFMMGRGEDVFHKYYHNWDNKNKDDDRLNSIADNAYDKKYNELSSGQKDNCKIINEIGKGNYKYVYFAYSNGGTIVPVADCFIDKREDGDNILYKEKGVRGTSKYTAFQIAFLKCLEASDIEKGYGFSMMDFSKSDEVSTEELEELLNSAKKEEIAKMSLFGTTMAVDCFGDVITMGANHQVVAVPGCMNPYVWQAVDKDGKDIADVPAGSIYNIANAISMTQAGINADSGTNTLILSPDAVNNSGSSGGGGTSSGGGGTFGTSSGLSFPVKNVQNADIKGLLHPSMNFGVLNKNLDDMRQSWSIANTADGDYAIMSVRCQRGDTTYKLNSGFLGMGGTKERDFLKLAQEGFKILYPNDQTYQYSSHDLNPDSNQISDSWWNGTASFDCSTARSRFKGDNYYGVSMSEGINMFTNVVFIDSLGAYTNSDGTSQDYSLFNIDGFVDENGKTANSSISFGTHSFGNLYKDIKTGKLSVPYEASEQALCTLYVTYCFAGLYSESNKGETIGRLGFRINTSGLPDMSNSPLIFDSSILGDAQLGDIKNWIYYILHPTDGFDYFRILITNKVNHLLLGWHNDMTGTNGVGITAGITKYRSTMGYVTMPDLSEIQWTNSLIDFYNNCIPFLIVILIILMVFAFITGILDIQHAIAGVLIFAVFTLMPVNLINGVVGQSNRISQNIYGDKFTYWALVQQESYATAIDEAANANGSSGDSTYANYLRTLYSANESVYNNQGSESILLKWQAPKKMASLVLTQEDANSLSGLNTTGQKMLGGMLNKSYSGESYVDDEDSVYMYRSYLDISNFSRYIYRGIDKGIVSSRKSLSSINTKNWHSFSDSRGNLIKSKNTLSQEYKDYILAGYNNGTDFDKDNTLDKTYYLTVPLSSNIINDALSEYGKIEKYKDTSDLIPINSDVFNFGIPMFTNDTVDFDSDTMISTGMITETERKNDLKNYMAKYTSEEDYVGLAAYGLYSENPYYYFSWKLYEDGLDSDSSLSGSTGFKNLLLGKEEGGYFYNTEGNGGLKDFMNMKGLFTYIIPYMKQCNDIVREWDNTYGIFIYDGVPTEEGHWSEVENDPDLKQKYWHNLNVTRLYNLYCPWVDVMYDCSYSEAENITVMGKRVTIEDPLNPNSYPADRPMIFSESEMSDYGLSEADLTKAEKLILKCNEQFQERLYEMLNYYNFSDVTLDSAAAMNCAFVFNNTFSENGLFIENHNIYPQSFDLANFSYDAFLRFILSNATGESMLDSTSGGDGTSTGTTSGDFYERLVNRSSIVTVLIMLVLDVVSIYVIPAFRIFFLVALFLLSIMLVLVSAFRIEDSMKFIRKILMQFLLPLGVFFGATIAFSWIVSLFMGVGSDSVTQSNKLQISMGDPAITMICMLALNILLLIVYWKVLKQALKDIAHHAKLLKGFGAAVVGAGVGFVAGAVASGVNGAQDVGSRAINGYRRHKFNKRADKDSESLERIANNSETAQQGTGIENSRANTRGASDASANSEEIPNVRDASRDRRDSNTSNEDKPANFKDKKDSIDSKAENGADISKSDNSKPKGEKKKDTVPKESKPEKVSKEESKESSTSSEERVRNRQRVRRESNKQTSARAEKTPNKESKSSKDIDKKTEK